MFSELAIHPQSHLQGEFSDCKRERRLNSSRAHCDPLSSWHYVIASIKRSINSAAVERIKVEDTEEEEEESDRGYKGYSLAEKKVTSSNLDGDYLCVEMSKKSKKRKFCA